MDVAPTVKLKQLRDRLHEKLQAALGEKLVLTGHPEKRLPNTYQVPAAVSTYDGLAMFDMSDEHQQSASLNKFNPKIESWYWARRVRITSRSYADCVLRVIWRACVRVAHP